MISSADQRNICAATGISGDTIHTATASSSTPKICFTVFIQTPAFGNSAPSDTPTTIRGTPMPSAMTNRAAPPVTRSRDCDM